MQQIMRTIKKLIILLIQGLMVVSCIPKEEKPHCCEQTDTVEVTKIDTSLLHATPYFSNNKSFLFTDSSGNELTLMFYHYNSHIDYSPYYYPGICYCDDNYIQEKLELGQFARNHLYSEPDTIEVFELFVYFLEYNSTMMYSIRYENENNNAIRINTKLDDFNSQMNEITINGKIFYNVRLGIRNEDTLFVANFSQGVVAFRDMDNKWWALENIEDIN